MACPQCENGYIRIADELYEAILRADFSKRELLIVLAVIRKTYGYRKTIDMITSSQIAKLTGIDASDCRATVRALKGAGVLVEVDRKIGIQKDYERWWGGAKHPGREGRNTPARRGDSPQGGGVKHPGKAGRNTPEKRGDSPHTTYIQTTDSNSPPLPPSFFEDERKGAAATSPTAKPRGEPWTPPAHLNLVAWREFEQHRREIGKPLSDLARTKAANQLASLNHDEQQHCIDLSIQARWAGLFPEKVKVNGNATYRGPGQSRAERYARMQREAEERAASSFHAAGMGGCPDG